VYYAQHLRPASEGNSGRDLVTSKIANVRQALADPSQALIPVSGGHGGYGKGLQTVKARNAGEAKWAKKAGKSFRDQRTREDHKTRVGYVHNSQKREQLELQGKDKANRRAKQISVTVFVSSCVFRRRFSSYSLIIDTVQ
jgi:hypothetical protein